MTESMRMAVIRTIALSTLSVGALVLAVAAQRGPNPLGLIFGFFMVGVGGLELLTASPARTGVARLAHRATRLTREERWALATPLLILAAVPAFVFLPAPANLAPIVIGVLLMVLHASRVEARDRQRWPEIQAAAKIARQSSPASCATPTPRERTPRRGRCPACHRNVALRRHDNYPTAGLHVVTIGRHMIVRPPHPGTITECPASGAPLAAFAAPEPPAPTIEQVQWGTLAWAFQYDERITDRIRAEFTEQPPPSDGREAIEDDPR